MHQIEQLKYRSYVKQLQSSVQGLLDVEAVLQATCTLDDDHAYVTFSIDVAYPALSLEYKEKLPPVHMLIDIKTKLCTMMAAAINSRIRQAATSEKINGTDYMLVIVDGNNLAHRSRHVYKLSHNGLDTSIRYGVLRSLALLHKKFNPYRMLVCFDGGIPEWRRSLVPGYKANRHVDDTEDYVDITAQIRDLFTWLPQFGIFTSRLLGYEADDIIASFCASNARFMREGQKLLVVSGDKDLYQLVSPYVDVVDPMAKTLLTHSNFETIVKVPKESYLLYRALVGDASDNLPGVPGIGPVKAQGLIKQYPNFKALHLAMLKGLIAPVSKDMSLIMAAGGGKYISNVLSCIDLTAHMPNGEDVPLHFDYQTSWKLVQNELIKLGFISLMEDDLFVEMVRLYQQRHGLVGLK